MNVPIICCRLPIVSSFLLYLFFSFLLTSAQADELILAKESVQADISTRSVSITSSFTGTEIIVFGAVENARRTKDSLNPYDVVVVVEGVSQSLVLRRKSNVAGLWFNNEAVYFSSIPSYYAISTNRPLVEITEPHILDQHGIGFMHISMVLSNRFTQGHISNKINKESKTAIVRLKHKQGLYVENRFGTIFVGPSLFRTSINLPANVPVGPLTARVHLFRDGILLDTFISKVQLSRKGIGRYIYNFASNYPVLYGFFTVVVAAGAGWGASKYFSRRRS